MSRIRYGCIIILLIPMTLRPAPAAAPAGGGVATITAKVLKVEDAPPNSTTFTESAQGKRLQVGAKVSTGKRAKAEITLDDKSVIRMGQTSDIVINPNREIDLPKGQIKFDFKNPARIRAGSTVADVRGSSGGFSNQNGVVRGVLLGGFMVITRPNTPPIPIAPGQTFAINTNTGQVSYGAVTGTSIDSSTGDVAKVDPLGDSNFGGGNISHSVGGPTGQEMLNTPERQTQDTTTDAQNPSFKEAMMAATGNNTPPPAMIAATGNNTPPPPNNGNVTGQFGPPATGGVNVGISNRVIRKSMDFGGSSGATSSGGGAIPLPRDASGSPKPGYFAPHGDGNFFVYWGQNGAGSAAIRLRTYGTQGQLYYEVATVPTYTFQNSVVRNNVTDAYFILKDPRVGDFTIGRQRFLKGPVQNTIFGTLLRQGGSDIKDAVTWSPHWKNPSLGTDISYIIDAFPSGVPSAVDGSQNGFQFRQQLQTSKGTFGFNANKGNYLRGWGTTIDWSVPAIREHLDFYGEFGSDGLGRQIRTFGLYFPGVYDRFGFDVFLEQSRLIGFGNSPKGNPLSSEWLLRVYRQLGKNISGLITVDERTDSGVTAGVGLVYKIQFK